MLIRLAALWLVGVLVATPFVVWWARDFGRIPGRIWYWSGYERRGWQWAVLLGWLGGGVIAIAAVLRWRRSPARSELFDDLRERVAAHDARVAEEARIAAERRAAQEARILRDAEAPPAPPLPDYPNVSVLRPESGPTRLVPSDPTTATDAATAAARRGRP